MFNLQDFFDKGGDILYVIAFIALLFWAIVIHKLLYNQFIFKDDLKNLANSYSLVEKNRYTQNLFISQLTIKLKSNLPYLKYFLVILPLLGLLGTVIGMIEIFDTIAINGTGEIKAISAGISKAVLTTLSGLSISIFGILFVRNYENSIKKQLKIIEDRVQNIV